MVVTVGNLRSAQPLVSCARGQKPWVCREMVEFSRWVVKAVCGGRVWGPGRSARLVALGPRSVGVLLSCKWRGTRPRVGHFARLRFRFPAFTAKVGGIG